MATDPVSGVGATKKASDPAPADASSAAQKANTLNYNDFLQLLIAQLKTQDPTAPNDPTQQISQLASFSQVEQQIQSNAKLDSIISQANLQVAEDYTGKFVSSTTDDKTIQGVISSVKVYSDGVIATLEDGTQVLLAAGVSVSDKAPTKD